ncbi:MAG: hypothetical protein ACYDAA_01400 [Syntrophales bacterium]
MAVTEGLSGEERNGVMMIEGRILRPEDRIIDLVEALEHSPVSPVDPLSEGKSNPEKIYDLVDVVERKHKMAFVDTGLRDEIMKRAAEITEKVAREVIPGVAERIIREEIEKLKRGT